MEKTAYLVEFTATAGQGYFNLEGCEADEKELLDFLTDNPIDSQFCEYDDCHCPYSVLDCEHEEENNYPSIIRDENGKLKWKDQKASEGLGLTPIQQALTDRY